MAINLHEIPPLLHDARLSDCRWDRHLKPLDLSFRCLRRNVDGTPIKDSTVDLKLGGVERIIAYYSPAVAELCKRLAEKYPTGPLFRQFNGKPLTPERIRNWLFKTRQRLGLGRVICYGYRHGIATDALTNGVPHARAAALLGHSRTAMLHKHYSRLTAQSQALREALGRVR